MIDITIEIAQNLSGTSRLICTKAIERGWSVRTPYISSPHFFINRGHGPEMRIFSSTPPTTSYAIANLVNNKYATSVVLAGAGIKQLPVMILDEQSLAMDDAIKFMDSYGKVVVKPIDGGHGNGITVGVDSIVRLTAAHCYALDNTVSSRKSIVQKQFIARELHDIRVSVIAGKVVGGIDRIPARVMGDGDNTIARLIEIENQKNYRGEPYRSKLARIDFSRAAEYLGDSRLEVPAEGEWRSVMSVANYGAGGELLDVTDSIPGWMRSESIEAATKLGLDVAGVDYLIDGELSASLLKEESQGIIIEVNKCPALGIHDEPTIGINRQATEAYLDLLATL